MSARVRLEPEIAAFVAESAAYLPPGYTEATLAEQRAMYRDLCRAFDRGRPPGLKVGEHAAPGPAGRVPLRLYRPPVAGPQGGLLYLHGGSWYLGDLDSHDSITADLAARTGLSVVAVDYRLAPEHPFPAAFEDAWAALAWLAGAAAALGLDPARLGVAGDSAGGNLAAALCLAARDRGGPAIAAQLLAYPSLALDLADARAAPDAPLLSRAETRFARRCYLGGAGTTDDPLAAPLLADDFTGLPPAAILAAAADPIRPDAERYAARLAAAGVPAALEVAAGTVHGFLRARDASPAAGRAFAWLCDQARSLLAA